MYKFETSCPDSTAELIDGLYDHPECIEATVDEMRTNCVGFDAYVEDNFPGIYDEYLKIEDDWCVDFYRSFYGDVPCYFMVHSGIEHIWIKSKRRTGEHMQSR